MPDDLSGLSGVELHKAEAACEFLLDLHNEHQVAAGELAAVLGALLSDVRLARQDRARQHRDEAAGQADPVRIARMARMRDRVDAQLTGVPRESAVSFALAAQLLAMALDDSVTGLDELSWRELAARRAWLLAVIAAAGPGADHRGAAAGALVLAAVIAELAARARNYAAHADGLRWCGCGFLCRGLAAIDHHLDQFDPDDDNHYEVDQPPCGGGARMSGAPADHVPPGPLCRRQAA